MQKFYVLFTFELIQVKISDQIDQNSIIIEKQSQKIFKYIKNGRKIKQFIQLLKKLNAKVISYTAKNKQTCKSVYQAIDPTILDSWIFIQNNRKKYPGIPSNRAFQSFEGNICYGQGYSQNSIKGQLRLTIHSALRNFHKSNLIIVQKSQQEAQQATKQKYKHVFHGMPSLEQFQKQYQKIRQQSQADLKQQIKLGQHLPHSLSEILKHRLLINDRIHFFNSIKARTPQSKSICSFIALNKFDNKLYIHKTQKTYEVGGDFYSQQLQNSELASQLHNLCSVKSLPNYRNSSNILLKYSLLPNYDKKRAIMSVKPYIQGLRNVSDALQNKKQLMDLLNKNRLKGRRVKGMGYLIALSIVCSQDFRAKSFLQQTGFYQPEQQQTENKKYFQVFRFDFNDIFSLNNQFQLKGEFRISFNFQDFNLKELSGQILQEIAQVYQRIKYRIKLIQGLFNHHRWQFPKAKLFKLFQQRLQFLNQFFQLSKKQCKQLQKQCNLSPVQYNLLVGDEFSWFTRENQIMKQYGMDDQNIYLTTMRKGSSFELHSSMPQLNLLLRWIARKWGQVQYISLLKASKSECISLARKIKFQVEADKNKSPRIIVIDHCQLCPDIVSMHRPVKTIFITRLKRLQFENVPVIRQTEQHRQQLLKSQEQIFKVLLIQSQNEQFLYSRYQYVILTWIANKAQLYNIPLQSCLKTVKDLTAAITINDNRLADLECKQLYCLPIYKQKQKIYFAHDIYQFFRAKHLIDDILQQKWKGKLQTQQLIHFSKWIKFHSKQNQVKQKLLKFLSLCPKRQQRVDCIQLLKVLTNQIFLPDCQQFTFNVIKKIIDHPKYYFVIAKNTVFWYKWEQSKSVFKISQSYDNAQIYRNLLILRKVVPQDITIENTQKQQISVQSQLKQLKREFIKKFKIIFDIFNLQNAVQEQIKQTIEEIVELKNGQCFPSHYLFKGEQILSVSKTHLNFKRYPQIQLQDQIIYIMTTNTDKIIAVTEHRVYLIVLNTQGKWDSKVIYQHPNEKVIQVKYKQQQIEGDKVKCQFVSIVVQHSSILTIIEISKLQKIQLKHQFPVICASVSLKNRKAYTFIRNDDILLQWDLFQKQKARVFYEADISSIGLMERQSYLVVQGYGYIKKSCLKN